MSCCKETFEPLLTLSLLLLFRSTSVQLPMTSRQEKMICLLLEMLSCSVPDDDGDGGTLNDFLRTLTRPLRPTLEPEAERRPRLPELPACCSSSSCTRLGDVCGRCDTFLTKKIFLSV